LPLLPSLSLGFSFSPKANHIRYTLTFRDTNNTSIDTKKTIYFYDQRNFGTLKCVFTDDELNKKLNSLGPCWISDNISFNQFLDIVNSTIKKSKNKDDLYVAQFFMNQKKTAGIGNYVVSEVFYETMLWPFAKMTDLNEDDWFRVYKAIKNIIGSSYLAQKNYLKSKFGIIDDDSNDIGDDDNDYAYGDNRIFSFKVYSRSVCPKGFKIEREEGPHDRTIHWVPELQKRHKT